MAFRYVVLFVRKLSYYSITFPSSIILDIDRETFNNYKERGVLRVRVREPRPSFRQEVERILAEAEQS
jgi:hypothetical protein